MLRERQLLGSFWFCLVGRLFTCAPSAVRSMWVAGCCRVVWPRTAFRVAFPHPLPNPAQNHPTLLLSTSRSADATAHVCTLLSCAADPTCMLPNCCVLLPGQALATRRGPGLPVFHWQPGMSCAHHAVVDRAGYGAVAAERCSGEWHLGTAAARLNLCLRDLVASLRSKGGDLWGAWGAGGHCLGARSAGGCCRRIAGTGTAECDVLLGCYHGFMRWRLAMFSEQHHVRFWLIRSFTWVSIV